MPTSIPSVLKTAPFKFNVTLAKPRILHTNGRGLWSDQARTVRVLGIEIDSIDNEEDDYRTYTGPKSARVPENGEMVVVFDPRQWNIQRHGLIYTDPLFLRELRQLLRSLGLNPRGVTYSEQGMQGRDYVSLDVDAAFYRSLVRRATRASSSRLRKAK